MNILLVEDSPDGLVLTLQALKEARVPHQLEVTEDGEAALALLRHEDDPPDLVLLGLSLPRKSGPEIVAEIKQHPQRRYIPVILLVASADAARMLRASGCAVDGYAIKPLTSDALHPLVRSLLRPLPGQAWHDPTS